jgi:hypothetical protein
MYVDGVYCGGCGTYLSYSTADIANGEWRMANGDPGLATGDWRKI